MTDNEIIKALGICIDFVSGGEVMCNDCPLYDCENCSSEKLKQSLDLINRQTAEIERLTTIMLKKEDTMQLLNQEQQNTDDELQKAMAEIERLKVDLEFKCDDCKYIKLSQEEYRTAILKAKSEAIREFAERLKEKATSTFYEEHKYVDTEDIDNLKKEMVGDE